MTWIKKIPADQAKIWQDIMLDHSYDYEEWGEARECLKLLLKNDLRNSSESSIRSYIACCAEASGNVHPLPELKQVVEEFYGQYGMENSTSIEN